jgi:hypothetical protein
MQYAINNLVSMSLLNISVSANESKLVLVLFIFNHLAIVMRYC